MTLTLDSFFQRGNLFFGARLRPRERKHINEHARPDERVSRGDEVRRGNALARRHHVALLHRLEAFLLRLRERDAGERKEREQKREHPLFHAFPRWSSTSR